MKSVIIIAIAFVLLIPSNVFGEHATTYKEHWDSLCQYDYDRKMKSVDDKFKDESMKINIDILQKCQDEFISQVGNEVIPDDDIIHPTCDLSCLPKNYQFGTNRIQDKDVLVCFEKYWTETKTGVLCVDLPQGVEMQSKHKELEQIWEEVYQTSNKPEFYPMEPFFKQFTDDDAFCLLESEDYKDCLAGNGALDNIEIDSGFAYTLLYQGCHNTARNLMVSEEMTRAEASYVFNVCEVFPDYILEVREIIPVEQPIEEPRENMIFPEPTWGEPKPNKDPSSDIICGEGTVLIDHICQVDKTEKEVKENLVEKSVDTHVEEPVKKAQKKSGGWFDWLWSWFQ